MTTDVRDLAIRYAAAWAAHDVDAIMALHTEDTVFHLHGGGEPSVGWSATRETFAKVIEEWPDIRFEPKRVRLGSAHFVSEYLMSATKDGHEIACDGVDVFSIEDGLVARKDSYVDWVARQRQLDALAAMPA